MSLLRRHPGQVWGARPQLCLRWSVKRHNRLPFSSAGLRLHKLACGHLALTHTVVLRTVCAAPAIAGLRTFA